MASKRLIAEQIVAKLDYRRPEFSASLSTHGLDAPPGLRSKIGGI